MNTVMHRGVVKLWTKHIDGAAVWSASRCDYAVTDRGAIESINLEQSDWFPTAREAEKIFGRETKWPDFDRLRSQARALAEAA